MKKAAPVILPLALAATPLGPIYGAALGSGIGTLISGGSPEDTLRNAVIAGASGAVYSGIRGGTAGISQAFADPAGRFGQTATGIGQGNFFGRYQAPVSEIQTAELKKMLPEGRNLSAKIKEKDVLSNLGSKTGSNIALDPKEAVNLDLGASVDRVGAIESLKQGEYFDAFTGGPNVTAADVAKANNIDITKLSANDRCLISRSC